MTNIEKIKNMTDEELAEFLVDGADGCFIKACAKENDASVVCDYECYKCARLWLNRGAEDKNKRTESDSGEWQDRPIPPSVFHYLLLEWFKKKDSEMYKKVYKVTEDITLKEFLIHRTQALQLCTIRSSGWIEGTTWIDYEDLFINSLDKDTLDRKVESYEMGTLKVLDADGNKVDVPCMHIDLVC